MKLISLKNAREIVIIEGTRIIGRKLTDSNLGLGRSTDFDLYLSSLNKVEEHIELRIITDIVFNNVDVVRGQSHMEQWSFYDHMINLEIGIKDSLEGNIQVNLPKITTNDEVVVEFFKSKSLENQDKLLFLDFENKKASYDLNDLFELPKVAHSSKPSKKINFKSLLESDKSLNRIFFGAPGTGKSFELNRQALELTSDEKYIERITFHPDYTYSGFVGTYKPVMRSSNVSNETDSRVVSILQDKALTAQEKYDMLYDDFKGDGLTRLPILLGLYVDDDFSTLKKDGSVTSYNSSVEKNHGKALRPYVNLSSNEPSSDIAYEFIPGPFIRTLVAALQSIQRNEQQAFVLIIEEINRANTAAVFGDVFQLLDRTDELVSEYPIHPSEDIKAYLAKELNCEVSALHNLSIPSNMFIWATMNSADQGVYPMDTAFKRRWDFDYIGLDEGAEVVENCVVKINDTESLNWNKLRGAINTQLLSKGINEDKLIGPFFISKNILNSENPSSIKQAVESKLLMYLFEDLRHHRKAIFVEDVCNQYSKVKAKFNEEGKKVFHPDIQQLLEN